ncbi:MAG: type I glyceraldehyde-3-phosphate dehydrogenase [Candidatus Vogelbacteria bacterium RIFOXYD1_FULL_44_32]|uniref:Type I glyceraldehyde-3-phosphate dehydrogenase n=1 Tax=Candidatus Vogelbacteria bacterium RIFOXYD1_FULL_44_32 TaxID=1802438 RepID=A0A1G2QCM6_9BACT|nr:MAG: type I glyceraldehyde-3-phosphate dehydrogenase [Candidatus Vogelbacteria bacterium RIFOXYD1_FULL_44_32]
MRKTKVAINGLGRIGRAFLKLAIKRPEIEIVAVNDLGELENLAYLLKYDSAYVRSRLDIDTADANLNIGPHAIKFLQIKDPAQLPWRELDIDVVVEATGVFESYAKSKAHIDAGARKVVISAPVKDEPPVGIPGGTVLMGVNDEKLASCQITSNASCTTNSASPLIAILNEKIGIEKALLNTVHGYTASQSLVDAPMKGDWRRGRAAAHNIVPSSTGAAVAVTQVVTDLKDKFDGIAMRVPVITGSLVDITFIAKRKTSVEEINNLLKAGAEEGRWQDIFMVTEEPLVSSDIAGNTHASIADLSFTRVVGGNLCKVLAWYDNEMGYANTLVEHVIKTGK